MAFYEFNNIHLIVILLATIIPFKWVLSLKNNRLKTWYILLATFLCLYSGIGGAIKSVETSYIYYYIGYVFTLGITLYLLNRGTHGVTDMKPSTSFSLMYFIDKYGSRIIILYFGLLLFDLVYPSMKLHLLISPPTPSLEGIHYVKFVESNNADILSSIVYLIRNTTLPFFYLALYKYRDHLLRVLIFLLLPVYIDLCVRGIVGRGQMLLPLLIGFFSLYETLSDAKKKILLLGSLILVPFFSYLMVQFSYMRLGASFKMLSLGESMQLLFGQEIAYPLHFSTYFNSDSSYVMDYIMWLLLLPLPGFMKFGYGDPLINLHFTQLVLGLDPTDMGFSICLPGLVGESIFVFGKMFFFIHAIIMAVIINKLAKYLCTLDSFRYLFYYVMLVFTYYINRGGTASSYSFAFKQFLILIVAVIIIQRKYKRKQNV